MSVHEVTAKINTENKGKIDKDGNSLEKEYNRSITLPYEFYDGDLQKQVEEFGEDVVSALFVRAGKISLRNQGSNWIRQELSDEEIATALSEWKPPMGVVRAKQTPMAKATKAAESMGEEDLDALIRQLKEQKKALK